jgi:putrescine aminotransferase
MGDLLMARLRQVQSEFADFITEVRGKGLLVGVEFADADIALLTAAGMLQRRVLTAYTLNNPRVIRLEPPLIVQPDHIDLAVNALAESLQQVRQLLVALR